MIQGMNLCQDRVKDRIKNTVIFKGTALNICLRGGYGGF